MFTDWESQILRRGKIYNFVLTCLLNQNLSIFQGKHRWSGNFEGPLEVGWMLRICDEILRGKKLKNLRANISKYTKIQISGSRYFENLNPENVKIILQVVLTCSCSVKNLQLKVKSRFTYVSLTSFLVFVNFPYPPCFERV